jgi:hypothetical protein
MTQLSLGSTQASCAAGEIGSRLPEFSMKELQGRELIRFARKASESGEHKPTCFHGVSLTKMPGLSYRSNSIACARLRLVTSDNPGS